MSEDASPRATANRICSAMMPGLLITHHLVDTDSSRISAAAHRLAGNSFTQSIENSTHGAPE